MSNSVLLIHACFVIAAMPAVGCSNEDQTAKHSNHAKPTVLFRDDFDGPSLNEKAWTSTPGKVEMRDGMVVIQYHTHDPANPTVPPTWAGGWITSKPLFGPGGVGDRRGLIFEARLKVVDPPRGLNAAFFTYENEADSPDDQDEIDIELLTNRPDRLWLNTYNNRETGLWFNSRASYRGFDIRDWHVYQIRWGHDGITEWRVDGKPVRMGLFGPFDPPDEAMRVSLSYWKPDANWPQAFDDQLDKLVAADPDTHHVYEILVDYVEVRQMNADE